MIDDNRVDDYISRQLQTNPTQMANKARSPSGSPYFERSIQTKIDKQIEDFYQVDTDSERWLIMPGLRGVGKSTVLAQTYLKIQNSDRQPKPNLLQLSLDECRSELGVDLKDIMAAYSRRLGQDWVYLKTPTFILIDEIQADPNWATTLKVIYEKTRLVFFICTGSSATALQISTDAVRRSLVERLFPLNFGEYQLLTNGVTPDEDLKESLINAIYFSESASAALSGLKDLDKKIKNQLVKYDKTSLDNYLALGTMPSSLGQTTQNPSLYNKLRDTIDRILVTDLVYIRHFDPKTIDSVRRLLFLLADTAAVVSAKKLNRLLKTTDRQLLAILDALAKAEILIKVPAWGESFVSTRKPARYYFMSPAIRVAYQDLVSQPLVNASRRGQLLEDLAALHYHREFTNRNNRGQLTHVYDKRFGQESQCDFILKLANSHQLAIEFGLGTKGIKQVQQTMKRADCRYGLVFANSQLSLDSDKAIVTVPLDYFYLM